MRKTIKCTQKYLNLLVNDIKEETSNKEKAEKFAILGAALLNGTDDIIIPNVIEKYAVSIAVDGCINDDEHLATIGNIYYNLFDTLSQVENVSLFSKVEDLVANYITEHKDELDKIAESYKVVIYNSYCDEFFTPFRTVLLDLFKKLNDSETLIEWIKYYNEDENKYYHSDDVEDYFNNLPEIFSIAYNCFYCELSIIYNDDEIFINKEDKGYYLINS